MKRKIFLGLIAVSLISFVVFGVEFTSPIGWKIQIERSLEERIQQILVGILGENRSRVIVNATLKMEKIETTVGQTGVTGGTVSGAPGGTVTGARIPVEGGPSPGLRKREYLPGIPMKHKITEETIGGGVVAGGGTSGGITTTATGVAYPYSVIEKLTVWVILDRRVPEETKNLIRKTIETMVLDTERGDKLEFETAPFAVLSKGIFPTLLQPAFAPVLIAAMIILMLSVFLFGPIRGFFRSVTQILAISRAKEDATRAARERKKEPEAEAKLRERMEKAGKGAVPAGVLAAPGGAIEGGPSAAGRKEKVKPRAFSFIKHENVRNLFHLIKNEPPELIAHILGFLSPDIASEVLATLPPAVQGEVALQLTRITETDPEEVRRIEEDIKEMIGFIIGGINQVVEILDRADPKSREIILSALAKRDLKLADVLRKLVFTFENIVEMPTQSVQVALSQINTASLSIALRTASEQIQSKIMKNMSKGAVALLKEEIEFGKPVTPQRIEEEQGRIVTLIRRLAREGKIVLRGVEAEEELRRLVREIEMGAAEKEKIPAQSYSDGIKAYQEGRYEEAIEEFKKTVEQNPDNWQAYQYLGSSYYGLENEEEALKSYEQALKLNPENAQLKEWVEAHRERVEAPV